MVRRRDRGVVRLPRPSFGRTRNDMMMGWGSPRVRRVTPPFEVVSSGGLSETERALEAVRRRDRFVVLLS